MANWIESFITLFGFQCLHMCVKHFFFLEKSIKKLFIDAKDRND